MLVAVGRDFVTVRDEFFGHKPAKVVCGHADRAKYVNLDGKVPNIAAGLQGVLVGAQQLANSSGNGARHY